MVWPTLFLPIFNNNTYSGVAHTVPAYLQQQHMWCGPHYSCLSSTTTHIYHSDKSFSFSDWQARLSVHERSAVRDSPHSPSWLKCPLLSFKSTVTVEINSTTGQSHVMFEICIAHYIAGPAAIFLTGTYSPVSSYFPDWYIFSCQQLFP